MPARSMIRLGVASALMLWVLAFPVFASDNKQIAKRYVEAFAAGDMTTLTELVAENVIDHAPPPGSAPGLRGLLDAVALFRTWLPDLKITVDLQVAEGALLAQYGTFTGTNTGSFMGKPATGSVVQVPWMDVYRIDNGKIIEIWHVEDIAGMMAQLGIVSQ